MSFSLFPRLPTETRLYIWNQAIPSGRLLRVLLTHNRETFVYPLETYRTPAILHVCHESREVALGIFRHDLGTRRGDHFWWNPRVDVVFRNCLAPVDPSGYRAPDFASSDKTLQYMKNTRHLALTLNLSTLEYLSLNPSSSKTPCMPTWLHQFPHLETLTVLLDPMNQWICSGDLMLSPPCDHPIRTLHDEKPSKILDIVKESLELFGSSANSGWVPPTVQMSVLTLGRMDDMSFWLPETKTRCEEWKTWLF